MSTVDYFEAWTRWAGGDATLREATLWGLRIYWWARIGKIMAFVAGLILVLDIIGPDKIVQRFQGRADHLSTGVPRVVRRISLAVFAVVAPLATYITYFANDLRPVLSGVLVPIAVFFVVVGFVRHPATFARIITWLVHNTRLLTVIRTTSLFLFITGFHFDMLGS